MSKRKRSCDNLQDDNSETVDIIGRLLARHMCFIVESIFQCLDYESLKSASLVCETWGQAILQGRLWQKLLEKNVEENRSWKLTWSYLSAEEKNPSNDEDNLIFYCNLTHRIGNLIHLLKSNWLTGKHSKHLFHIGNKDVMKTDHRKTVTMLKAGHDAPTWFRMWERLDPDSFGWLMKTSVDEMLELNGKEPGWYINEHFAFHQDVLVTGFHDGGQLGFWDLRQLENSIPHIVVDNPVMPEPTEFRGDQRYHFHVRELSFSPSGRFLLAAIMVSDRMSEEEKHFVDLWSVTSRTEVRRIHRLEAPSRHRIKLIGLDDELAVFAVKPCLWVAPALDRCHLEVRSNRSFHSILKVKGSIRLDADYAHGLLATMGEDELNDIILRRVGPTGADTAVRIIPNELPFRAVRLVENDYVITLHENRGLRVWDLSAALKCPARLLDRHGFRPGSPLAENRLKFLIQSHINPTGVEYSRHRIQADEFGITLTVDYVPAGAKLTLLPPPWYQSPFRRLVCMMDFRSESRHEKKNDKKTSSS